MMSWMDEIVRAFFVAFGAMQTISNATYLMKRNGLMLARRQHKELPADITDGQMKVKVVCMLFFGLLMLGIGLFSFLGHAYHEWSFLIGMGMYMVYALGEAIYYKFWRPFGAFVIAGILFVLILIQT